MLCCLHYFSKRSFSFFPFTCPWVSSSCGPLPTPLLSVSMCLTPSFPLFFILYSSSPALFCPCLFLSLYRTPNVSSNGNPGYESLPLTDRQSPPPSVSSSVPVTPSHSVPFFSLLLVLTLALITSSKWTNVIHFYFNSLKPLKSAKHIRKNICPF